MKPLTAAGRATLELLAQHGERDYYAVDLRTLARLEADELVDYRTELLPPRRPGGQPRRREWVRITDAGRAALKATP